MHLSHNFQVRSLQVVNHIFLIFGFFLAIFTSQYVYLVTSLVVYWIIGVLGINVYLHRLLSHRSFKTYTFIEKILGIISVITTVGSPLAWVCIHRQHHRKCETDKDPHSPYHIGNLNAWFGLWNNFPLDIKLVRDLRRDPFQRYLHKNYVKLIFCYVLILLIIDPILIIYVYAIPACLCLHSTSAIIVIAHKHGYKTYNLGYDQSRNSWIANLITLGEGWHNNHHAKPWAWTNWEKWWEWDIPSVVIRLIRVK